VEHAVQGKLKEVVASAWTTFTWQSSKEGERLPVEAGAFKDWLSSRPLALRPIYWEISSDAYTHRRFKMGYEAERYLECAVTWNRYRITSLEMTGEP